MKLARPSHIWYKHLEWWTGPGNAWLHPQLPEHAKVEKKRTDIT
jgi:hypothetical protein